MVLLAALLLRYIEGRSLIMAIECSAVKHHISKLYDWNIDIGASLIVGIWVVVTSWLLLVVLLLVVVRL